MTLTTKACLYNHGISVLANEAVSFLYALHWTIGSGDCWDVARASDMASGYFVAHFPKDISWWTNN